MIFLRPPRATTQACSERRRFFAALVVMGSLSLQSAEGQGTGADEYEPNNTCTTAAPMHINITQDLTVEQTDPDYYSIEVPPGETCNLSVSFLHAQADIDVRVFSACSVIVIPVASGLSNTDHENVSWTNMGSFPEQYFVQIYTDDPGGWGQYDMYTVLPLCPMDDRYEPNNACNIIGSPSPLLTSGTHNALVMKGTNIDYFRVFVPAGATADATVWIASGGTAHPIGVNIYQSCGGSPFASNLLTGGIKYDVRWTNTTGAGRNYLVRIAHEGSFPSDACTEYDLVFDVDCTADDNDEDHDSCPSALPIGTGTLTDRVARLLDDDWYEIVVPNSATLRVTCLFIDDIANLDMAMYTSCLNSPIDSSLSGNDDEEVLWTNDTGQAATISVRVFVNQFSEGACNTYDLNFTLEGGTPQNVVANCFGDGSGTPCPCNNNSLPGHEGGCAHQNGLGAILFATSAGGPPSVGVGGGPEFQLTSGPTNSFGILVSGDNALPQIGFCLGCGLAAFDGLRCVGGNFLRHGSRAIDSSGNSSSNWGAPSNPTIGIAQASGFIEGQTRHFQAFFRTALDQTCGTGQNATNGISVTFGP